MPVGFMSHVLMVSGRPGGAAETTRQSLPRLAPTVPGAPQVAAEVMPCEDLWRLTQALVAAHQVSETVPALAEHAVGWVATLSPFQRLRLSGLLSAKFHWLGAIGRKPQVASSHNFVRSH